MVAFTRPGSRRSSRAPARLKRCLATDRLVLHARPFGGGIRLLRVVAGGPAMRWPQKTTRPPQWRRGQGIGQGRVRRWYGRRTKMLCESWNERMSSQWTFLPRSTGPSTGDTPWLEIRSSRCTTRRDVDLAPAPSVDYLRPRSREPAPLRQCANANRRPPATLLKLAQRPCQAAPET